MQKLDLMNVKFIIRKNREAGGLVPIQMQVTLEGVRLFVSTGQKIEPNYWDVRTGRSTGKGYRFKVLNEYLDKMSVDAYRVFNEMKSLGNEVTPEDLRRNLTGKNKAKTKKLLEVCDIFNSNAEKLVLRLGKLLGVVVSPKVMDWAWREMVMMESDNIFAKVMFIYIFDHTCPK